MANQLWRSNWLNNYDFGANPVQEGERLLTEHIRAVTDRYRGQITSYDVVWTRGEPKWFHSSNAARRGFCAECGTPLTYETKYGLELAIGAFDDPSVAPPTSQVNPNDKQPVYDDLSTLPVRPIEPGGEWEQFKAEIVSYQHPDHDTDDWTPGGNGA